MCRRERDSAMIVTRRAAQGPGAAERRGAPARLRRHLRTAPRIKTYEGIANLTSRQVDSWKEIPGAQPAVTERGFQPGGRHCARRSALRAEPCRSAAFAILNAVVIMAWTAGYFALPGAEQGRIVRAVPYYAGHGAQLLRAPGGGRGGARQPDHSQDYRLARYRPQRRRSRARTTSSPPGYATWRAAPAPLAHHPAERGGLSGRGRRGDAGRSGTSGMPCTRAKAWCCTRWATKMAAVCGR